ncbi:MAG: S8 family serine peptidase, partial [candidate division Zixibacteria bacterium]|nr:S8 family serine peptidase [candidate division Zixibacteria bacterium]
MSFGLYTQSDLVNDAIAYAYSKGVILCAAIGNDGAEQYNYPAAYDKVIAIGATNNNDNVTSYSTYGSHIDLCAPGQSILSLRANNTDMYASSREAGVHIIDDLYYLSSGTSMASPQVVGAAAYLRSVSPGLTPEKVLNILQQTADDLIDPFGAGWNNPGYDIYSGYGRLNLNAAIQLTPDKIAIINSPDKFEIVSGIVDITGYADGSQFPGYILEYGAGKEPENWQRLIFSSNPITDGTLFSWNTDGLTGIFTIRLRVGFDNIAYQTIYIANNNTVEILYPEIGETLNGITSIGANAYGPEFTGYQLKFRPSEEENNWEEIHSSSIPAYDNIVGEWYTSDLPDDTYILKLTMYSSDNTEISDEVEVVVQSLFSSDETWKVSLDGTPSIIPSFGDFDGDGINEIVIGTSTGIYMYNPDGTPKTENIPDFPENNFIIPIAVGELDGDGIDDLVALGYDPPMVYSFCSSEPDFTYYLANYPSLSYTGSEYSFTKLFLKDMDSDGRDEIIVHMYDRTTPLGFIIKSDGSSHHMFPYVSEFLTGDLNNDGLDEIYAFNYNFSSLRQLDINGNTISEIIMDSDGKGFTCSGISAGDIDN